MKIASLQSSRRSRLRRALISLSAAALVAPAASMAVATSSAYAQSGSTVGQPIPDVVELTISQASNALESGSTTSAALVTAYLARITAYDDAFGNQPGLNATISLNRNALAEAKASDAARAAGATVGPLQGVPIVVKDNYNTSDMATTNGSVTLKDFHPANESTVVKRLRAAGAIVIAKTNLHEFAAGITTVSSLGGQTRNPYNETRLPSGSSGGTAAAVAASFATGGLGTDTGGSIRGPASNNNLVGLRPTKGLTSIYGVAPLSPSQDVTGPITKDVRDAALLMDAFAGYDAHDPSTSVARGKLPSSFTADLTTHALVGKRLALMTGFLGTSGAVPNADEQPTAAVIYRAVAELRAQGAEVIEISALPADLTAAMNGARTTPYEFQPGIDAYLAASGGTFDPAIAALTTPTDKLTLTDLIADGHVDPEVLAKIKNYAATANSSSYSSDYAAALANRKTATDKMHQFFEDNDLDAIIYPHNTSAAGLIAGPAVGTTNDSPSARTGFPALDVPVGFTADTGMPVGLEMMGLPFSDAHLLGMGYDYEQATRYRTAPIGLPELVGTGISPADSSVKVKPNLRARLTDARIKSSQHGKVLVTATAPGVVPVGKFTVRSKGRTLAKKKLRPADEGRLTIRLGKLKKGTYVLRFKLSGSATQEQSVAKTVTLKVT